MREEIFKPIKGYEGYYEVSSFGRIKSLARRWSVGVKWDTILKHGKKRMPNTYLNVTFCVDKIKQTFTVHRLVATLFCENPNGYDVVNHLDGDVFNNHYKNLEWTTCHGNTMHAFDLGLRKGFSGESNGMSKHRKEDILKIRELHATGLYSQPVLAGMFNCKQPTISKIVLRQRWANI